MKRYASLVGLVVLLVSEAALAVSTGSTALSADDVKGPAWGGSSVFLGNSYNTTALYKGTNLNWRPDYRLHLGLRPVWKVNDTFTFSGRWGFSGAFYESGLLEAAEPPVSLSEVDSAKGQDASHQLFSSTDLALRATAVSFYRVPFLDLDLSTSAELTLPTSDYSWTANPMYLGLAWEGEASRFFNVLRGLSVAYSFGVHKTFYESYAGSRAAAISASEGRNCFGFSDDDATGLSRCLLHNGVRNPVFGVDHGVRLSFQLLNWLALKGALGASYGILPDLSGDVAATGVSFRPQVGSRVRYSMAETLAISVGGFQGLPYLSGELGVRGLHGTLGLDGQYLHPFDGDYGNYLRVYLNLNVKVGRLLDALLNQSDAAVVQTPLQAGASVTGRHP